MGDKRPYVDAFPWVLDLPVEDARAFGRELSEIVGRTSAIDDLLSVIAQWRHTAEVHADPELLLATLRQPAEDHGRVERP